MLVLSRKVGETIVIDGGIRLTVTAIHGRQARIGIEAPREVALLRDELPRRAGPDLGPPAHGLRSRDGWPRLTRVRALERPAR
jgi:carbon storage regulator